MEGTVSSSRGSSRCVLLDNSRSCCDGVVEFVFEFTGCAEAMTLGLAPVLSPWPRTWLAQQANPNPSIRKAVLRRRRRTVDLTSPALMMEDRECRIEDGGSRMEAIK